MSSHCIYEGSDSDGEQPQNMAGEETRQGGGRGGVGGPPTPTGGKSVGKGGENATEMGHPWATMGVSRRAIYLCLTRDGMHLRAIAKRLKMPRVTVGRAVDFLLAIQAIEPDGARRTRGRTAFFRKGPKATDFEGWPSGPLGGGVAPPQAPKRAGLIVDPHRGTMKVPVEAMPNMDPAKMPGCYNAKPPNWWFRVQDAAGHLWSVQLSGRKDGKTGVILVTPPTVRTRDLQAVFDQGGRQDAAQRLVLAWGGPFELKIPRARGAPVQVQPMEYSMPGFGLASGLRSENGTTYTDPSQGRGSVETQDGAVVQSLSTLPEDMGRVVAGLREVQRQALETVGVVQQATATIQAIGGMAQATAAHALATTHALALVQANQAAGVVASLSPLPKNDGGAYA